MDTTRITLSYLGILAIVAATLFLLDITLELNNIDSYDRKGKTVSLRIDLKELDAFTAAEVQSFKEYLVRDARWRVLVQNKSLDPRNKDIVTTAKLRNNRYGIWLENENVHFANGDNPDELQVEIHFGFNSIHDRYPHSLPKGTVVAKAFSETTRAIPYQKSYNFHDKRFTSELVVERPGVVIQITENAREGANHLTERFLDYLREVTKSIKEKGLESTDLSVESRGTANRASCFFVSTTRAASALAVRGWVNPGEAGTVSLKALGIMSGKEKEYWHSETERIGWSKNPSERFYFAFWNTSHRRLEPQRYRYVLVFRPDSGAAERDIIECDASHTESYEYTSVLTDEVEE